MPDFFAHAPEHFDLPSGWLFCRIVKAPMNWRSTRENGALLFCAIAYCNDVIELLTEKLLNTL